MKKILFFVLSIVLIAIGSVSCNSTKTAQEYLKEEKKATDRFINRSGFVILNEYPQNGVFKENEYFKTSNGLYFNVVDSGNGKRATMYATILVRFEGYEYFKSDTTLYPFSSRDPFEFKLGITGSFTPPACSGWEIPLSYVGEGAILNLIVPSDLGTTSDRSEFKPIYYKRLKYTKFT